MMQDNGSKIRKKKNLVLRVLVKMLQRGIFKVFRSKTRYSEHNKFKLIVTLHTMLARKDFLLEFKFFSHQYSLLEKQIVFLG